MIRLAVRILAALLMSSLSLAPATSLAEAPAPAGTSGTGVDGARIVNADTEPQNWLSHGRSYSEQRFSPLDQIDTSNVEDLAAAWVFETGTHRGLEATPIVVDGVLYATGPWSVVYALDAATGRELWRHDPQVPREMGRKVCCDVVNRGVAIWQDRIYLGTLDGRLVALDARTGALVWQTLTVDPSRDYSITGAPRIVEGKVIIGNGGAEFGVRGYVSAYDARDGRLAWRFYTVPAGPEAPFEHPELAMAAKTWSPNSRWESGLGGTVWDSLAYDPELRLLYVGVGNASPYDREVRSPGGGDNLFLASILALDPDTGKLAWHYQTTPGENWDYTATQHMILAEIELAGRERKVLMQAPKNGFFYVLDRATGELLSANGYAPMNWASHVDLATGRPVETGVGNWSSERAFIQPGIAGAHNWHPMAFSPKTGLVYVPTLDSLWLYIPESREPGFQHRVGSFNTGEDWVALAGELEWILYPCSPSHLTAWDPVAGKPVWRVAHSHPGNAGVLATAGDLVFQGNGSGRFSAYAADTGRRLWESQMGAGIMAAPVSYAVDGVQYVAVLAGLGGSLAINYRDLENRNDGRIVAYKLGGKAAIPAARPRPEPKVEATRIPTSPENLKRGHDLFHIHCARCHGFLSRSTGLFPDLRYSSRAVHDSWFDIVLRGAYQGKGMASFADVLQPDDVNAIHAYVVDLALREPSLLQRTHAWARDNLCVPSRWIAD